MNKYDLGLEKNSTTKSITKQWFHHAGNDSKYLSYTTNLLTSTCYTHITNSFNIRLREPTLEP
jgi:hypothetical protein